MTLCFHIKFMTLDFTFVFYAKNKQTKKTITAHAKGIQPADLCFV